MFLQERQVYVKTGLATIRPVKTCLDGFKGGIELQRGRSC